MTFRGPFQPELLCDLRVSVIPFFSSVYYISMIFVLSDIS